MNDSTSTIALLGLSFQLIGIFAGAGLALERLLPDQLRRDLFSLVDKYSLGLSRTSQEFISDESKAIDKSVEIDSLLEAMSTPNYVLVTLFVSIFILIITLGGFASLIVSIVYEIPYLWLFLPIFLVLYSYMRSQSTQGKRRYKKFKWHEFIGDSFISLLSVPVIQLWVLICMVVYLILWSPAWLFKSIINIKGSTNRTMYYAAYAAIFLILGLSIEIVAVVLR
jgi:hypothetical protein